MAGKPCGIHRHFNPRTHEECDSTDLPSNSTSFLFQSTHSRGVRHFWYCNACFRFRFQSTHSRGVRLTPSYPCLSSADFNPRTHEECDGTSTNNAAFSNNISIHALTRSATIIDTFRVVIVWDFNPRTHEECDKFAFNAVLSPFNFNPRTHEECD